MASKGNNRKQETFKGSDKKLEAYSKNNDMTRSKYEDDFIARIGGGNSSSSPSPKVAGNDLTKVNEMQTQIDALVKENESKFQEIEVNYRNNTVRVLCRGNENASEAHELIEKLSGLLDERYLNSLSKEDREDELAYRQSVSEVEKNFEELNAKYLSQDLSEISSQIKADFNNSDFNEILDDPLTELIDATEASDGFFVDNREIAEAVRDMESSAERLRAFMCLVVKKCPAHPQFSSGGLYTNRLKQNTIRRFLSLTEEEAEAITPYIKPSIKENGYSPEPNYEHISKQLRSLPKKEQTEKKLILEKLFYPRHKKGYATKRKLMKVF